MGIREFDRKFGPALLRELPATPAVYLFRDASGDVLYVGKARNVRRRLASYRGAGRRRSHRKMRALVREASSLEVRLQPTEAAALRVESELIRTLRPRHNVDGAFDFLYPAIGTGRRDDRLLLCFTTAPEAFAALDLVWHGSFRPRRRALEAFDALTALLGYVGHREPRSRLPAAPRRRGARLVALRRTPPELLSELRAFLDGSSRELLPALSLRLVESAAARRGAAQVQDAMHCLEDFYRAELVRLREAREATGRTATFVPRQERDALFLEMRLRGGVAPPPNPFPAARVSLGRLSRPARGRARRGPGNGTASRERDRPAKASRRPR